MPYDNTGMWYAPRRSSYRCSECGIHFASDSVAPVNAHGDRVCTLCRSEYYTKKYAKHNR